MDEWPSANTHFVHPAPSAGYWLFPGSSKDGPGARFHMPRKPSAWDRFWMRFLLGFVWVDL
jgi:hypothetical protein